MPPAGSVANALCRGKATAALTFAGQADDCLPELAELYRQRAVSRQWIERGAEEVEALLQMPRVRWSGRYARGFQLLDWMRDESTWPDYAYRTALPVSHTLVFVVQIARYAALFEAGLGALFEAGAIVAAAGHSQGTLAALLVAESPGGALDPQRFRDYLRYQFLQGLHFDLANAQTLPPSSTDAGPPMVSVAGPTFERLGPLVEEVNASLSPTRQLVISLRNSRTRHVISGAPASLGVLRARLEARSADEQRRKKTGQFGGRPQSFRWEPLAVSGAFHSSYMTPALDGLNEAVHTIGFRLDAAALEIDVMSGAGQGRLNDSPDLLTRVIREQMVEPVRWPDVVRALAGYESLEWVLDIGPGTGLASLSRAALRGTGLGVLALASPDDERALFTPGSKPPRALRYDRHAPRIARTPRGDVVVNGYTRATGNPPVILPGMTPTTVDVPIVAAAANAGFTAELAGGGQVTETIFWLRMEELAERLEPGREAVFNALYLDRYLWDLHLGRKALVLEAKRAGFPLCGVTVSAGVPELGEAVELLERLHDAGLWLNAFKPGTAEQVRQVVRIAEAVPRYTLFMHLEGGKAGGHHSWEDLDQLLLETYDAIRHAPNLLLCVGGGIAGEDRAVELLTGRWAERYDEIAMPVDAVFLGTLCMSCHEAATSPQVKAALVAAAGSESWVFAGQAAGGVTSGKSQLNADIHYLDNPAARCGRLLDAVAGDEAQVAARRDEIVAALNATAKPYFGDLETMTYADVLERMVELMAVGRHGRYEDGVWPDVSYRERTLDFIRRIEARLCRQDEGLIDDLVADARDLDDPRAVLARVADAYPEVATRRLHLSDAHFFLREICERPGKPVNFVPVIDANVRRWYKADALWQAHDDRFDAGEVLVIPGPQAVAGIRRADEPVADLLGRFEQALVLDLEAAARDSKAAPRGNGSNGAEPLPAGIAMDVDRQGALLRAIEPDSAEAWLDVVSGHYAGAVASLLAAPYVFVGRASVKNPARALCRAEPGARLRLRAGSDGVVTDAVYQPGRRAAHERLEISLGAATDGEPRRIHLRLHTTGPAGRPAELRLSLSHRPDATRGGFVVDPDEQAQALGAFFGAALLGTSPAPVGLFETVWEEVRISAEQVRAYRALTGLTERVDTVPPSMAVSLAWPALFRALLCDELADGLLRLVHLEQKVETLSGWPIAAGEAVRVSARVTHVEDRDAGRLVHTDSWVHRGDVTCARLTASFFIRGAYGRTPHASRRHERFRATVPVVDAASAAFLLDRDWIEPSNEGAFAPGNVLTIDVDLRETTNRDGVGRFRADGCVTRGDDVVARVALDCSEALDAHPVVALVQTLGGARSSAGVLPARSLDTPRRTLGRAKTVAPLDMAVFAEVSGDFNPIHRSPLVARLAGLDEPIVHGMWTCARAHAFTVAEVAGLEEDRVRTFETQFVAPVQLGERLSFEATRIAVCDGDHVVAITASADRHGATVPVLTARARVAPPRTAYVFPGQGIQRPGMGMDGYARSAAARRVWDRADVFTRAELGFSILEIVRDNPRQLTVAGEDHRHPDGVLHLTQFTQVAMTVLASAQVAELSERGVLARDAITCGHSVGEYNALSALTGVLPLETVVSLVYQRGSVMHHLVPRDERGESGFAMGVVRPHAAGLDEAGAEALVAEIRRRTGSFIEIVNYNVRGRQYAVTGTREALQTLSRALVELQLADQKAPFATVPGIDVPFHSSALRAGVASFRERLAAALPEGIDPARLVGRYVPNLVARPFALERDFAQSIVETTGSSVVQSLLDDWDDWHRRPEQLTRELLIELLAWQFASPVRWIETQDCLLTSTDGGGLGVERLIEVGVGYQPTLANMARYTTRIAGDTTRAIEILNVEADAERIRCSDSTPPEPSTAAEPPRDDESAAAERASAGEQARPHRPAPAARPARALAVAPPADRPLRPSEALRFILAMQARVRPEQIADSETIDELFDGVSSRRNQVLLDLGAELELAALDGAHEKPIRLLSDELDERVRGYRAPGAYLRAAQDEALKRVLGKSGLSRKDVLAQLQTTFGFGHGLGTATLDSLALEVRSGDSARGGTLGREADAAPATKVAAEELMERLAIALGDDLGIAVSRQRGDVAQEGGVVDAAAVRELASRLTGPNGVLMQTARDLAAQLGHELTEPGPGLPVDDEAAWRLAVLDAEYGSGHSDAVAPIFEAVKHVAFTSAWAFAQRDIGRMYFDAVNGRLSSAELDAEAARLARHGKNDRVVATARWYRERSLSRGLPNIGAALERIATATRPASCRVRVARPRTLVETDGQIVFDEVVDGSNDAPSRFVSELQIGTGQALVKVGVDETHDAVFAAVLRNGVAGPFDFEGQTALVTGASPGSIALELVRQLLSGGAIVIVTTTTFDSDRLLFYRRVYQEAAGPGAELHVVPFNQASKQDVEALLAWLYEDGRRFAPDLLVPFAAMKDLATLDQLEARSEVALRAMLLGVERLLVGLARRNRARGRAELPVHALLPLSPNHGSFGGDGLYAESKAALETLLHKWHAESEHWGAAATLCGARIGWVRGTGLMDANNAVAAELEASACFRTFSASEMGFLLAALCTAELRDLARHAPLRADLTGGFDRLDDVRDRVQRARQALEARAASARRRSELEQVFAEQCGQADVAPLRLAALPNWPGLLTEAVAEPPEPFRALPGASLEQTVVIVGAGEIGPLGSARTRFELEVSDRLSAAGVVELAWTTGLVRFEAGVRGGAWVDTKTDEVIEEAALASRYRDAVMERVGARLIEPESAGFDPGALPVFAEVYLERDFTFPVSSAEEARSFVAMDSQQTRVHYDATRETWMVTRARGSVVRVPRQARLARRVAATVPEGFDPTRYGIPADMVQNVDRVTLFNLVATVDAMVSAGLTPEELLSWVHPARVANTQGGGLGGQRSLRRLYLDRLLDNPRQKDVLQETLINVMSGYVVQSYMGGYGPMAHPVGACATAALSVEEGFDKIRAGKADFVVAGGFDDMTADGMAGFSDMNATASSDEMAAMGLLPHQMSRANDARRKGFVEAQGGGTLLLARGDVALRMGLPVLGVVAYAGSFGDGLNRSVPAPGMGALAAASGGQDSPLARALRAYGLSADDIGVVSKHDTSTLANDPNENALHQRIQEALGRSAGNPLWVISQKTLTGHVKGGAAAWQCIGLCQAMASGVIPGNRNLECVDDAMRPFDRLAFTDETLRPGPAEPLRAGLVTSLGFGHVNGLLLIVHPAAFEALVPDEERLAYLDAVARRRETQRKDWEAVLLGRRTLFEKRSHRRFEAPDGTPCQAEQEASMLLDPQCRFDASAGVFVHPPSVRPTAS